MNMGLYQFQAAPAADDPKRDIRIGAAVAIFFFVVLLGWAALTPLDAAVRAGGVISVLGNRQAVQHPTGGVVTALNVREGQQVRAGEILLELSAPETRAAERALTSDYFTLLAQRARLVAERSGQRSFEPPTEFAGLSPADRQLAEAALKMQVGEMRARAAALAAQQSVLGQRGRQLAEQRSGYAQQRQSLIEQQRILGDELEGMREVAKKGFASINRIRALERADADLRGQQAAMTAQIARAGEGIGETRMQSLSLSQSSQEEVATQLRETEARISEVLPKLISVREQLQRSQIRAPATGRVVGLSIFTVGGVVDPGQTLMEIVPDNRTLVVRAHVDPADADDVYVSQEAQLRFESVRSPNLPLVTGTVRTISADRFTDESTGKSYFLAEIDVQPSQLDEIRQLLGRGELRPGLPVDAMLPVRKRTALQYLLEPLTSSFRRALHEQ
jgi:HlyD family type I secretion membrane fusion protein